MKRDKDGSLYMRAAQLKNLEIVYFVQKANRTKGKARYLT